MAKGFTHLHVHSAFSLLDGLGRIDDILTSARGHGMDALALTDHGTLFGAIDFYSQARDAGIKPIVGCEVYVADRPLEERPGTGSHNYHLVLLAENETGYRNLIQLSTEAHLRGFYRKPRVDHKLLQQHAEGLICLSACASGELATAILADDFSRAQETADWYHQLFGDRYYLEIQDHGLDFQRRINEGVVTLSRKLGLPLVASNDVHYVAGTHARTHEILLCIQTQTTMSDAKRMRLGSEEFYLKSAEQMAALFPDFPEALANTLEIADRCNLELSFGRPQVPRFETPDGQSSEQHLRALCDEGARRRYGDVTAAISERLEYELSVITKTGFVDYFLLVHDVIHFARSAGIGVGPGRGSAAGSLVAYVLYLTNIDPIAHDLSFERFLNPERVTMPDMDLDFSDDRRDEVIKYVTEKYGRDRVAQIITFGTIGPRAGVRDVGRALGMTFADVDRVAKLIPFMSHHVADAKEEEPELRNLCEADPQIGQLLEIVESLEGVARHASTHAAGVVIARDPLSQHVPLYKVPKNDQITTQYAMGAIEKIGLLKIDFLGLRTLTILQRAQRFVEQSTGATFDLDSIDINDPSIYELLSTGETFGIFQVDGNGYRRLLRDLQPDCFEHIVAANALFRPGPIEQIPKFIERRHGREAVRYDHPALEEVLKETHGIVVYQEQVMRLFSRVAGYSMGEADLVRRAMGKKKAAELAKHKETFFKRAEERGTDRETALRLWNIVEPFAGYAFNKSHAAAYSLLTCMTAYLKANFPVEYMAGLLSAERENGDKVAGAMAECRRLGIRILPPDVNSSQLDFTLDGGGIRFGLGAIKHVGTGAVESLINVREDEGPFSSFEDFCSRVDWSTVNKRVLECLAKAGALDGLGVERARVLASIDRVVSYGAQAQRAAALGQVSLFGDLPAHETLALQLAVAEPATIEERVSWEQELLGTAVSKHPVTEAEGAFRAVGAARVSDILEDASESRRVSVGGAVRSWRSFSTKNGKPMATLQITDLVGSMEVVVFPRAYEHCGDGVTDGQLVVIDGRVDAADGQVRLVADRICRLEDAADRPAREPASSNGNGAEKAAPAGPSLPRRRVTVEY
ncbi:MAG TPA: DNA polymerase III subunit alpha, partial [Chloroflexota bacterium]|nr:DNA polymerase III subunit alpha [Chloroflexota bacterium]